MSFNQFSIYSVVSQSKNKSENEVQKILNLVQKLDTIKDVNKAREYLKETWNIDQSVINFPIAESCTVTTKELENSLKINFICKQENITYYYNK